MRYNPLITHKLSIPVRDTLRSTNRKLKNLLPTKPPRFQKRRKGQRGQIAQILQKNQRVQKKRLIQPSSEEIPDEKCLSCTKLRITVAPRPIRPLIAKIPKVPKLRIPKRPLPTLKPLRPIKIKAPKLPKLRNVLVMSGVHT